MAVSGLFLGAAAHSAGQQLASMSNRHQHGSQRSSSTTESGAQGSSATSASGATGKAGSKINITA
jgi:hypothetical protein